MNANIKGVASQCNLKSNKNVLFAIYEESFKPENNDMPNICFTIKLLNEKATYNIMFSLT